MFIIQKDTPSITAKLINEQKEDKEKKNHEEKEKMKADSGFQDNYSVVVASGTNIYSIYTPCTNIGNLVVSKKPTCWQLFYPLHASHVEKGILRIIYSQKQTQLYWSIPFQEKIMILITSLYVMDQKARAHILVCSTSTHCSCHIVCWDPLFTKEMFEKGAQSRAEILQVFFFFFFYPF